MGAYSNNDNSNQLNYEEMKQFTPNLLVKRNVEGSIKCDPASLGGEDPHPGKLKQCYCVHM